MPAKDFTKYIPLYGRLLQLISRSALCVNLSKFLARAGDSTPLRLFIEHKRQIALFLYITWLIGCGYWFYQLMIIDVKPKADPGLVLTDSRDALVLLFFGIIGFVFVAFFAFFAIKYIHNLFQGGIESLFSVRWHSVVKPVSYLVILYFSFSYIGTIKMAGLTAYSQVAEIVQKSKQHDVIIIKNNSEDVEEKVSGLLNLMDRKGQK
jgi:hypothetical protein